MPLHTPVLISPSNVCQNAGQSPYVAILIPCVGTQFVQRQTVRDTWTSIRNFGKRSDRNVSDVSVNISLIFVVASRNLSSIRAQHIYEEIMSHGDILLLDMEESYTNLVYKVDAGMRWVTEHCRGSHYLLKVDIDVYVHLPNLIPILLQMQEEDVVIGNEQTHRSVLRYGHWKATFEEYIFCSYLNYTEGNSYVISMSLVPRLLNASQYIPLIHNEDVYITGVLRSVCGARLIHSWRFATGRPRHQSKEQFFEYKFISETRVTIVAMKQMWLFYLKQI